MQSQEPQPASQKNIEYEFRVVTDDNAPIGCEIGTDRERQMDVLEMLAELETLKGFILPADSGVTLRFSFSNEPEDVYIRFISEGHWQEQYPYENQRIAVPEEPGIYNIFVDICWSEEISETAFFSIAIQERDNISDSNFERLTGQVISIVDLPSFSTNERALRAGTQDELEVWYQTIASATDDTIAKITICDIASSAFELTLEQANAIIRILKNAKPKTFSQLGNPATGGTVHIVAYDLAGEMAWHVSFDDYWFTVDWGTNEDIWVFDGQVTDLGDLKNFTESEPMEPEPTPTETGDGKENVFPGLPVYVETEKYKAASQAAIDNPSDEPQEMPDGRAGYTVFDHFGDPPPDGTIRLVYDYNYGEVKVLTIENQSQVSKILNLVDSFKISDYNSGPLLGGYMVQIQVVRNGTHQCYSVLSGMHNGGYLAVNGRDAENWYETSEENFKLLMDYFGGIPQ